MGNTATNRYNWETIDLISTYTYPLTPLGLIQVACDKTGEHISVLDASGYLFKIKNNNFTYVKVCDSILTKTPSNLFSSFLTLS